MDVIMAFALNAFITPLILLIMQRILVKRLDDFDRKRETAREERKKKEKSENEQREAERAIVLAIARTMLLDNYEKCMRKGCYTVEEREVYGKLYASYIDDGGNGIIGTIAQRIRELPLESPRQLNG